MKHKLELYYFPECPFCQKVLNVLKELNLDIPLKNIHQDKNYLLKLESDTGSRMVPCLYINDKPMKESDDIIKWLKKHY